jgi:hypothetical protein
MDWVRNNPVLSGVIAATVVGCGALGFLLVSGQGHYAQVKEEYDRQAAELARLQGLKPFPDQANLDRLAELKGEYESRIGVLFGRLSEMEKPVEPLTPEQFQDRLKQSVTELEKKAAAEGVKLPEGFFLGFEEYRTQLPPADAAPVLGRQLASADFLCGLLVESKIAELRGIQREPLPEEPSAEKKERAERDKAKGGKKEGEPGGKAAPMVAESRVTIQFLAEHSRARRVLNMIAAAKDQFLVVRNLAVANEQQAAPSKVAAPAAALPVSAQPAAAAAQGSLEALLGGQAAGAPAAASQPSGPKMEFLVGNERLDVKMTVGILDFTDPAEADSKAGKADKGKGDGKPKKEGRGR